MRKFFKIAFLAIVLTSTAFVGCKKYEEGPSISLRSKTARVANKWKMDKEFENGVEQTLTAEEKAMTFEFTDDNKVIMLQGAFTVTGKWAFDSKKENITITFDPIVIPGVTTPYQMEPETLKILKLKETEFWVETKDVKTAIVTKTYFIPA